MIPNEAVGKPCILIQADEQNALCGLGIIVAHLEHLTKGANRDQKRSISSAGRTHIHWLLNDHPYPANFWQDLESRALRNAYEGEPSPVKKISQKTGIAPTTIRKWYTAKKPPTIGHFLILVQNYPSILKGFLEVTGYGYLTALTHMPTGADKGNQMPRSADIIRDIQNVPNNSFNERQAWFLIRLQRTTRARAEDIAGHFKVAIKTARRDIEVLKMTGKIKFTGTKRTGNYEFIDK